VSGSTWAETTLCNTKVHNCNTVCGNTEGVIGKHLSKYTMKINVFKFHVSSNDRKISVRIKIEIILIFRLHLCPIQLVMLVPVELSLKFSHLQQV
jgi:hypothetical protein